MNQICYFEIEVDDPERAIGFYSSVFGWRFEKRQNSSLDYWVGVDYSFSTDCVVVAGVFIREVICDIVTYPLRIFQKNSHA